MVHGGFQVEGLEIRLCPLPLVWRRVYLQGLGLRAFGNSGILGF